jgi:hypothetical protein
MKPLVTPPKTKIELRLNRPTTGGKPNLEQENQRTRVAAAEPKVKELEQEQKPQRWEKKTEVVARERTRWNTLRSVGQNQDGTWTSHAGNENKFSIEIQTRFTSETQRSAPFLPHLIIGMKI